MARTDTLGNFLTDVAKAIRTKEGTTETIAASEFDTRISNLSGSGSEDLTEELTTYEAELEEQNLALDDIVLALKNKGSGGSSNTLLNVFTQEDEPVIKDGIWLQTNEKYDSVVLYQLPTSWTINDQRATIPFTFDTGSCKKVGDYVYLFGGDNAANTAYKYNLATNVFTKLPDIPWAHTYAPSVVIGTDIYLTGSWSNYSFGKFDTLTETYTKLTNTPVLLDSADAINVGGYIYTIGGHNYTNTICKYDIANNNWTKLSITAPDTYAFSHLFAIGTDIYIVSPSTFDGSAYYIPEANYKFDTLTETFTALSTKPVDNFSGRSSLVTDDCVYLFGNTLGGDEPVAYAYYPSSDTYIKLDPTPRKFGVSSDAPPVKYGDEIIYFFGTQIDSVTLTNGAPVEYIGNTVVITKNDAGNFFKIFNLAPNLLGFDEHIICYFTNVNYYSESEQTDMIVPMYYGDGTQWIKFKN